MDIATLTIDRVREGLRAHHFSATELADEALRFAEAENPKTRAYLHFSPERALAAARRVDERIDRGEDPGPLCGVVGVTPTYGRVSRYGLTAFASSLDHIGPFARSVKDAATVLGVIAGRDPRDATSAAAPVPDYTAHMNGSLSGLKLGLPREYLRDLTSETGELIMRGVDVLKGLGCQVREISLPATEFAIATYYIIATA